MKHRHVLSKQDPREPYPREDDDSDFFEDVDGKTINEEPWYYEYVDDEEQFDD